jgi:hypothetical protein
MRKFNWLSTSQREFLEHAYFGTAMPRGRGELVYRQRPAFLDQAEVDGKKHIIFNSYYLQPAVCKKAWALRDTGAYYCTFIGCCVREDHQPERFFDQIYEVTDYFELYDVLTHSAPHAIQSVIQPLVNGAVAVEAARHSGCAAVVDINDSLFFMRTDPQDFECRLEASILKNANSFVHKMPTWGVAKMRAVWDLTRPDFLVHSLPVRALFETCADLDDGPVRLVFGGGVVPYHIAVRDGHENHIMDPLIHAICKQGMNLTFVVNQNARNMFWEEHQRYIDFNKVYPGFSFERGVPFFALPRKLRRNHFAIYWENIEASSYVPDHFAINMATKIFSYTEAGLPIIIHNLAPYMRDILMEYDFGVVYELDKLDRLSALLEGVDHTALKHNLDTYRSTFNDAMVADIQTQAYRA